MQPPTERVTFGAKQVAAETNRRYRDKLSRAAERPRRFRNLRRLRDAGRLRLVREGVANRESLYTKRVRTAAAPAAVPEKSSD